MKAQITEVYVGYNFVQLITNPTDGQKGYAVLNARWTEVIYKNGVWQVVLKPK
jgi:hypothetical protein